MQTRDPTVKVLFALWSLAMVVTVIPAAAAAVYELPKITYYLVEEQNWGPASLYRYVGAFENYSDCVSARHEVDVLRFGSEGIAGGNFALGGLPKVCKLKALPAWVAAWSLLSVACLGLRANSTALGWRYPMVPLIELD
jgi:hypothetical protein